MNSIKKTNNRTNNVYTLVASLLFVLTALTVTAIAQQVKIYPSSIRLDKGKTRTVTAVAFDSSGNYLPNKVFSFSLASGTPGIASIRRSPEGDTGNGRSYLSGNLGEIAGQLAGRVTFTATVDGVISSPVTVEVHDPAAAPQATINGDNDAEGGQTIRVRTGEAIEVSGEASRGVQLAEWFWGDGDRTGDLISATHAYLKSGTYQLRLKVTNEGGQTSETSVPVIVTDHPAATREFVVRNVAELLAAYNQCIGGEHMDCLLSD